MRKTYAFKAILAILLFAGMGVVQEAIAQNYHYIGTGTTSSNWSTFRTPFSTNWEDSRRQYLIHASELTAAGIQGMINSLGVEVDAASTQTMNNLTISIAHTTTTALNAYESGLTVHYTGTHTASSGWNDFVFSTPFAWDGTSNIVVQICFDNTSYNGNSSVFVTQTAFNSVHGRYADGQSGCSMTGTSGWGTDFQYRANMRFDVIPPVANDAGVTVLNSPSFPTCQMDSNVMVTLVNHGTSPLTSAQVNWSVNGNLQAPYTFSGTVASFEDSVVSVGTYAGGFSDGDVLKVWSSNPNGVADSNALNDTIENVLMTSLSGTYVITGTGTGDFNSLTEAKNAAESFGICGPTVFELIDTLYVERTEWDTYSGMDDTNTITITSATGNPADVKVQYSSSSAADQQVFDFSAASHYILNGITIENTGSSYAGLITGNSTSDFTLTNNVLMGSVATSTSTWNQFKRGVYFTGSDNNDIEISNNHVYNCDYAIYITGNWTVHNENIVVSNNVSETPYYAGFYVSNSDHIEISGNEAFGGTGTNGYGIYASGINMAEIFNNYIVGNNNWPSNGMYCSSINGDLGDFASIYNNRIYSTRTSTFTYGLYTSNGLFTEYINNSIHMIGTQTSSRALYITGGQYNNFINNTISVDSNGYAVYVNSGSPIYQMDYNNVSAPSGSLYYQGGTPYATVADWTAATGYGANSMNHDNIYSDTMALKVCTDSLYRKGMMTHVMYDYEGEMRNDPPCIGADEFMPISEFGFTASPVLCDGDTLSLEVLYFDSVVWNQSVTSPTFNVTAPGPVEVAVYDGCGSDTSNFTVNAQKYADLSALNLCEGDTVSVGTGIPNGTYAWNTGDTSEFVSVYMPGMLSVEVIDENGCFSEDSVDVTKSIPATLADTTYFCEGGAAQLDPNTTGSYIWSNGSTSAINSVSVPGLECVTVTDANCTSTACSEVIEILNPVASFSDSSDYHTVIFTNTTTNTDQNTTYEWDFGDGNTSTDENPIHIYNWTNDSSVAMLVTLKVTNACGDFFFQDTVYYGQMVSVNDVAIEDMINVYPNPSNGTFNVELGAATATDVNVEVLDVRGAIIYNQNFGKVNGQVTRTVNLENAAAGIYFVKVNFNDQTAIYKLSVN